MRFFALWSCIVSLGLACARAQPGPSDPPPSPSSQPATTTSVTVETVEYALSPVLEGGRLTALAVVDQNGALRGFWPDTALGRGNAINAARLLARYGATP